MLVGPDSAIQGPEKAKGLLSRLYSTKKGSLTSIITLGVAKHSDGASSLSQWEAMEDEGLLSQLFDTRIVLIPDYAVGGVFPSIHCLASSSSLMDARVIGDDHFTTAQRVLSLLTDAIQLQGLLHSGEELSEEQEASLDRAVRMQFFLTQPFHTCQGLTGIHRKHWIHFDALNNRR